ncbi:MAG: PDZ domain-containing protein [Victivallales bacterium]|jgi:hypothetical protein|nr:PDZ domain-containing protein [Victivallales bacterium]
MKSSLTVFISTLLLASGLASAAPPADMVAYVGVSVRRATPDLCSQLGISPNTGLVVELVSPDSPATKAGVLQHDVLLKLNDQTLILPRQLSVLVQNSRIGEEVTIAGLRGGRDFVATVALGEQKRPPANELSDSIRGLALDPFAAAPLVFPAGGGHAPWGDLLRKVRELVERKGAGAAEDVERHIMQFRKRHLRDGGAPMALPPGMGMGTGGMMGPEGGMGGGMDGMDMGGAGDIHHQQATVVINGGAMASSSTMSQRDEEHELTVVRRNGSSALTAKDRAGNILFDGPIDTAEQRELVPPEVRVKLGRMERAQLRMIKPAQPERGGAMFGGGMDGGAARPPKTKN